MTQNQFQEQNGPVRLVQLQFTKQAAQDTTSPCTIKLKLTTRGRTQQYLIIYRTQRVTLVYVISRRVCMDI